MSSPGSAEVLEEADDHTLLDAVVRATCVGRTCVVLDPTWPAGLRAAAREQVARHPVGPHRLVLFTSGSTGRPRAVVRTIVSWEASLDPVTTVTGATADDVVCVPGPLSSSLYLYGAWHARRLGARVLTAADDPSSATLVHLVPAQLARLAGRPSAWPSLRTVVVAGDRLSASTRCRATDVGWRVVEYYGAAELSFVAWREDDGPLRPFPGVRVRVRDGVLWASSPYLAEGYLDDAPGPLRRDGEWATVGDLAREVEGGLELLGRGDAAVVTGGHTVVAEEVEAVLLAVPGVNGAVVVGVPDSRLGEVVAAVVAVEGASRQDLATGVRRLPPAARPRRWYTVDAVPTTPAGKPDRSEVRDAVRAGRLTRLR